MEFTYSQSQNHFGVSSIFVCEQKQKSWQNWKKKFFSVRSVWGNKNVLIIGLELFILSRVQIKVLASQTKIQSFDHM